MTKRFCRACEGTAPWLLAGLLLLNMLVTLANVFHNDPCLQDETPAQVEAIDP